MEAWLSKRSRGFPAYQGRSARQLGDLAVRARRAWCPGLADDAPFEGLKLYEQLYRREAIFKGTRYAIDTDVMEFPDSVEALTSFQREGEGGYFSLCLSTRTYEGLEAGEPRARFTLGHELGHLCMHLQELVTLCVLPPMDRAMARETARHALYLDTEWQADVFSSRLHVPDAGLALLDGRGRLSEYDVVHVFGVSRSTARARIEQYRREEVPQHS